MNRLGSILLGLVLITASIPVSVQELHDDSRLREGADEGGLLFGVCAFLRNSAQETIVDREINTAPGPAIRSIKRRGELDPDGLAM